MTTDEPVAHKFYGVEHDIEERRKLEERRAVEAAARKEAEAALARLPEEVAQLRQELEQARAELAELTVDAHVEPEEREEV